MSQGNPHDGALPGGNESPPVPTRPSRALPWWVSASAMILAGALAAVLSYQYHHPPPHLPPPDHPRGTYHTVAEPVPPLSLRLDDGTLVRVAGVAAPATPEEAAKVGARLAELASPDTLIYVEPEPVRTEETDTGRFTSVYLPPPGAGRETPFPYEESRLLGAVLVQEGLVREEPPQLYRYGNELEMLEHDARRHQRGLWANHPPAE